MNSGRTVFAQLAEFLPVREFRRRIDRYRGEYKIQKFTCLDQFLCIAFAQLTYRESLRDTVELEQTVYALDSTTVDLCLSLFPWAKFRKRKAAVKLHTLLDLRGNIPSFIKITDGNWHDVNILDEINPEPGSYYVMDRGVPAGRLRGKDPGSDGAGAGGLRLGADDASRALDRRGGITRRLLSLSERRDFRDQGGKRKRTFLLGEPSRALWGTCLGNALM